MRSAVMAYASQTESARQREVSLAEQERRRPRQYWTGFVAPQVRTVSLRHVLPLLTARQILADVLEAMTAVLFIHDGWKLGERVQRFFNTTLKPFFVAYISLATMEQHPTKVLCELVQGYGCHGLSFQKHASARNTITCNSKTTVPEH
jgi:dsRNA-specific ribonuclease